MNMDQQWNDDWQEKQIVVEKRLSEWNNIHRSPQKECPVYEAGYPRGGAGNWRS